MSRSDTAVSFPNRLVTPSSRTAGPFPFEFLIRSLAVLVDRPTFSLYGGGVADLQHPPRTGRRLPPAHKPLDCLFSHSFSNLGGSMAIFRTLYYGEVTVGVGGRITIPQEIRDDLRIAEGDVLTVRVEEAPNNVRQMVMWRTEPQTED
jgi:AbrB family looped-hinge helix DNA binding protein